MQRYEAVENGILNNDIKGLREAVGTLCYTSRDFSSGEFDEVVAYVEKRGIKLKDDKLEGELVSEGKTTYTDEDFAYAVFELKNNFCDERIADVKKIGKALYGKPKSAQRPANPTVNKGTGTNPNVSSHRDTDNGIPKYLIPVAIGVIVVVVGLLLLLLPK